MQFNSDDVSDDIMFGRQKPGAWVLESRKDPRFNLSGTGFVGGFVMPPAARLAMATVADELHCPVPDDLMYEYNQH